MHKYEPPAAEAKTILNSWRFTSAKYFSVVFHRLRQNKNVASAHKGKHQQ
jgi:hypothetical protein